MRQQRSEVAVARGQTWPPRRIREWTPPLRSFAADAYICIMVWIHFGPTEYKGVWHDDLPRSLAPAGSGLRLVSCYLIVPSVGRAYQQQQLCDASIKAQHSGFQVCHSGAPPPVLAGGRTSVKTSRAEKENGLAKGRKVEATSHPGSRTSGQNGKESELRC
jgi:hypothetical protein